MTAYLSLIVLAAVIVIAAVVLHKLTKLVEVQAKLDAETSRNDRLTEQMNSIMETQQKILEIRNEKPPKTKNAPDSSDERLARLNGMSEPSSGN